MTTMGFTTLPADAIQPEPPLEELEAFQSHLVRHWPELMGRYRDQFVAFQGLEVVDADPDLAVLYYRLRDRGLQMPRDVWVEFISDRLKNMVL